MTRSRFWPGLLLGLGVGFAGLMGWSVHRAETRGSPISDRAYYRHGAELDAELAARRAAQDAGWTVVAVLRGGDLHVRLAGEAGQPLTGADVVLRLSEGRDGGPLRLAEGPAGEYVVRLPARLPSPVPAQLRVARGDARLERSLLLSP